MVKPPKNVIIKDSTLREGLDVPGVDFSFAQRLKIARLLDKAKVPEIEVVAPSKVLQDIEFVRILKKEGLRIKISGLIYGYKPDYHEEIEAVKGCLDRFDILMPLASQREPYDRDAKKKLLNERLFFALRHHLDAGVGFPHSTQTTLEFLLEISKESAKEGAHRITIYDTNGSADPFEVLNLVRQLKERVAIPVFFHAHNDLGLATANSLAAVYAGVDGLDVTVNGLGDRAGNAALEQVVISLDRKGFRTGIQLEDLRLLSETVAEESGVEVSKLAPIVGDYVFSHKSPAHLEAPALFEAFDPQSVSSQRKLHGSS